MKMKKEKIILVALLILGIILISTNSFAAVSHFTGASGADLPGKDTVTNIISSVLAVIRTIGAGVAVAILMVIGCKYMLASAGERAEIKKYAVHYVIGAVVLFAASGLLGIIQNFVSVGMA